MTTIESALLSRVTGAAGSCSLANATSEPLTGAADQAPFSVSPGASLDLPGGSYVWARAGQYLGWSGFRCGSDEAWVADRAPHMGDAAGVPFEIHRS